MQGVTYRNASSRYWMEVDSGEIEWLLKGAIHLC
jgi:hypothetical protein